MSRQRTAYAAITLILAGCTSTPSPTPSGWSPAQTPALPDTLQACAHPSATAKTNREIAVGAPDAPTVGSLTFHLYPYKAGYPTKAIIHVKRDQQQVVALHGLRCSDGRPLRFWYDQGALPEQPPLTERQMQDAGDLVASLQPAGAGVDHTGYLLFTSPGRWEITVPQNGTDVGVLLVEVA